MSREQTHYAIEYGADGLPKELRWSSQIQAAGEARTRQIRADFDAAELIRKRPAPWIEDWLAKRNTTLPSNPP